MFDPQDVLLSNTGDQNNDVMSQRGGISVKTNKLMKTNPKLHVLDYNKA